MTRRLTFEEAKAVGVDFLVRQKMPKDHAGMVADHLIYATLAGHDFAGFSRLLPLAEMLKVKGTGGKITVLRETDKSAAIDGAGVNGYVTSVIGMDKAIELAKKSGVGIVSVSNSWFSGMLRYYVERAANANLVGMHAANTTARVAPHGGIDRLLGTNPIAFSFPADGGPLVIDFASASLMWGDVIYHQQLGKPLPEGRAVDSGGHPTVNPMAALAGAILPWGGPRGSGVSVLVQALGILGGSDPIISESGKWGYFFMAIDPELLMPIAHFKQRIGEMRHTIETSRPAPGGPPVRVPGSSSQRRLDEGRARGWIEVADEIYEALVRRS
jgi:LDH2 family malate/lactate/ureidoglycolate dehydrogenase